MLKYNDAEVNAIKQWSTTIGSRTVPVRGEFVTGLYIFQLKYFKMLLQLLAIKKFQFTKSIRITQLCYRYNKNIIHQFTSNI